jgi:hypothetical protein
MFALLFCLFAADPEPTPSMKAVASGPWRQAAFHGKKALVIRQAEDLAKFPPYNDRSAAPRAVGEEATRHLAADMKVKAIDWNRQMVVIILDGRKGSGGYRVEVTGLKVTKGTLTVSWKVRASKEEGRDVITYPSLAVLLPKHTGKVVFDPPLGK